MRRRRARAAPSPEATAAMAALQEILERIEQAKESLTAAVPSRRGPGLPLAEALAGFEAGVKAASEEMPAWRTAQTEHAWRECREGLQESARRAEHLRLEASPEGYEELYATLGEILEPLDAFERALSTLEGPAG